MNKQRFPFLAFSILVLLGVTETALIASPQEADAAPLEAAPVGPTRAIAFPDVTEHGGGGARIDGAGFSVPLLAGFAGAALLSGDVVMTSRNARIDVKRAAAVATDRDCARRADERATMARTEAWRADGEGGCRVWMSLPRRHVIEVLVNHGAHAYVVTCSSKDEQVVQDVCAPVIGGLRIASVSA